MRALSLPELAGDLNAMIPTQDEIRETNEEFRVQSERIVAEDARIWKRTNGHFLLAV